MVRWNSLNGCVEVEIWRNGAFETQVAIGDGIHEESPFILRVYLMGALPYDSEFRVSGTAVKYHANGHTVKFISVTNGDTDHFEKGGVQLVGVRAKEKSL